MIAGSDARVTRDEHRQECLCHQGRRDAGATEGAEQLCGDGGAGAFAFPLVVAAELGEMLFELGLQLGEGGFDAGADVGGDAGGMK